MAINLNIISLNRKIRIGLGFSLLILIFSSVVSYLSITGLLEKIKWVDHTQEVLLKLENIITQISSAESGVRGYAITDDKSFLSSYQVNKLNSFNLYKEAKKLTEDNNIQQKNLEILELLMKKKI